MSRPGHHVRRFAARVCSERTRRRLIDPAVADLQAEVAAARRTGSRWRARWTSCACYFAIAKVLTIAVCGDLRTEACRWRPEERAGARRGLLVALLTTAAATGLLVANLVNVIATPTWTSIVYVVPSMLTLALPLGLVLGTAWTLQAGGRTWRLAAASAVAGALCSIALFANAAWLTPESNQTFRQIAFTHAQGRHAVFAVPRGLNELSLTGLRARITEELAAGRPHRARVAESVYYQRFVMAVAMLPMIAVIVALALRHRWERTRLTAAAVATFAVYYATLTSSRWLSEVSGVAPLITAWAGPALITGTAILLISFPSRARA